MLKGISTFSCEYLEKNKVLFDIGERGRTFYIVLSGKCQLYVPNPELLAKRHAVKDLNEKIKQLQKGVQQIDGSKDGMTIKASIEKLNIQSAIKRAKDEIRNIENRVQTLPDLAPILVYEAGMTFGELALIQKKGRSGTIVTLSDCHFAVINADTYEKMLKKDSAT